MSIWWPISFCAIAVVAFVIITFNELILGRNRARAAWSDVDVQLQRRHDLVPQLVAAVRGYADHEQSVLSAVAELRARAAMPIAQRGELERRLGGETARLLALQERYPQLKASENFRQLQTSLDDTENRLAEARGRYNATVLQFNSAIQQFPQLLLAGPLGFSALEFFQAEGAADAAPRP